MAGVDIKTETPQEGTDANKPAYAAVALKKSGVQGDGLWSGLQKELELTDKQRDAFRRTFEANKEFRKAALELLTQEQRAKFGKTKPKP